MKGNLNNLCCQYKRQKVPWQPHVRPAASPLCAPGLNSLLLSARDQIFERFVGAIYRSLQETAVLPLNRRCLINQQSLYTNEVSKSKDFRAEHKAASAVTFTSFVLRCSALSCKTSRVERYSLGNIWFIETRPCPSLMYKPPFFMQPCKSSSADRLWHPLKSSS